MSWAEQIVGVATADEGASFDEADGWVVHQAVM